MKNIKTARFAIHCFLMLALFPLVSIAQEELPPVENVRVENGAIVWDPLIIESGDQITIYNIYNVMDGNPNNRGTSFVTTVVDTTEFVPTEEGFFVVIASNDVNDRGSFSVLDEAAAVWFVPGVGVAPVPSAGIQTEIVTNQCGGLFSGESCVSACSVSYIPTGGACRASDSSVVHQRALFNGYECIATADVAYLEADVFCLK